jgi:PAS domain S-box-containing protein
MVLLITGELSALWFTINTLSAVRSYVAGEGLWSKAEKDCLYHLEAYGRTRDPREYAAYQQRLAVWAGDHQANLEFRSAVPDLQRLVGGLLQGGNAIEDIPGMIDLFRRFNSISFIAEAIQDWTAADVQMVQFQELAKQLHADVERNDATAITRTLGQISDLNVRLTVIENHFSNTLGQGSRWLTGLVLRVLLGAALLVEFTGLILTFAITRNISMRLTAMLHASERVSQGDFAVRLDQRRKDEIGKLAQAFNDMTLELERERKRAVDALAAREVSLREAQRVAHIGVWDWSFRDDVITWSKEVCRLHGMSSDEAKPTLAEFLALINPDDSWRVEAEFDAARKSGNPVTVDYRVALPEGSRRWLSADASIQRDDKGQPDRMVGTTRDITQRKIDEERIQTLNVELQHRYAELETFSYSVAHDLRGPLRTVAGFANALEEDYSTTLDAEAKRFIASINRGAIHMGSLIDALLSLASVSRQEISPLTVDLSAKANAIIANLQASDPGRHATVTVEDGMRAAGDSALLTTMLANLLGNAWKFTRDRDPAIIRFESEKRDGETVYAVRDNGIGFPMKTADNLFTPFKRLHGERYEGTGIGLATVARIVQRHGGRVWADSQPGTGATFRFTLGNGVSPPAT